MSSARNPSTPSTFHGRGGFKIPWIKGKPGRFCPHCGRSIRDFADQKVCPYNQCRKKLNHTKPPLPSPYIYCPGCHEGIVRKDDHNCTLCRWVTPYGRKVDSALGDLRLKQISLQKEFEATLSQLTSDGDVPVVVAPPSSRDPGSSVATDMPSSLKQDLPIVPSTTSSSELPADDPFADLFAHSTDPLNLMDETDDSVVANSEEEADLLDV